MCARSRKTPITSPSLPGQLATWVAVWRSACSLPDIRCESSRGQSKSLRPLAPRGADVRIGLFGDPFFSQGRVTKDTSLA
jgi:hypothetical protein